MNTGPSGRPGARRAHRDGPRADRRDRGQVTAFVVIMTSAFLLCLGLVFDGGGVLRARNQAAMLAQEAARVGAQQIDMVAYRAGEPTRLDAIEAGAAARAFLSGSGVAGEVSVNGDTVTVTCTVDYDFALLPLGGTTVDGTASARPYSEPTA
ncbi:TadE/TadG family type IV pilus assembly protein [Marinactinospora rubrisoli]|uniref:TadE/TadG family type IV pilus assembly protein n=1 Tax=Marinactinospora rubrisoli TaxID=2715399 RepID=A0ABW2KCW3_9ACTN